MNYKELQATLKKYKEQGLTDVKLNTKKEILEIELKRLESITAENTAEITSAETITETTATTNTIKDTITETTTETTATATETTATITAETITETVTITDTTATITAETITETVTITDTTAETATTNTIKDTSKPITFLNDDDGNLKSILRLLVALLFSLIRVGYLISKFIIHTSGIVSGGAKRVVNKEIKPTQTQKVLKHS